MTLTSQDETKLHNLARKYGNKELTAPKVIEKPDESFPEHSVQAEQAARDLARSDVEQTLYKENVPSEAVSMVDIDGSDSEIKRRIDELVLAYKAERAKFASGGSGSDFAKRKNAEDAKQDAIRANSRWNR